MSDSLKSPGKSSILDALRILAGCLRFAKTRTPRQFMILGRKWLRLRSARFSVSVPLENITYNYSEDDACLEFKHENGGIIRICLHPSRITRCVFFSEKRPPLTSKAFLSAFPVDFVIVPTLSPFEAKEPFVYPETVRAMTDRLASRNFNIRLKSDEEFRALNARLIPLTQVRLYVVS